MTVQTPTETSSTAPEVSPDGLWVWNGTEWVANDAAPAPTSPAPQKKSRKGLKITAAILAGLLAFGAVSAMTGGDDSPAQEATVSAPAEVDQVEESTNKVEEPTETVAQQQAIESAESYLDTSAFSRSGLIEQLEFEGFSTEDATYAVDSLDVDWNAEAVESAESYLDTSAFSRSGLIEQLEFEGFSTEDATYAVDSLDVDWNAEAVESAESYLDTSAFSRSGLIERLEFEGFTTEQATHAVDTVGL